MVSTTPHKRRPLRLGIIGRADQSGLASMTTDFARHLDWELGIQPARIILMDVGSSRGDLMTSWFKPDWPVILASPNMPSGEVHDMVDGLDFIVGFETFYWQDFIPICERAGVKTVIFPMWECSPWSVCAAHHGFNLTAADSRRFPEWPVVSWPMSSIDFPPIESRPRPKVSGQSTVPGPIRFVCNAGYWGLNDRNNIAAVCAAADRLDEGPSLNTVKIAVRSFNPLPKNTRAVPSPPKRTRPELYENVDCMIHLQGIEGLSLPLLEAASCRIPTLVINHPGNSHYPLSMRVAVGRTETAMIGEQEVQYHRPDLDDLVRKIKAIAQRDVPIFPPAMPRPWSKFFDNFFTLLGVRAQCFR